MIKHSIPKCRWHGKKKKSQTSMDNLFFSNETNVDKWNKGVKLQTLIGELLNDANWKCAKESKTPIGNGI